MKELSNDQLVNWSKGSNDDADTYFVIIKTKACPKCEALKKNLEKAFGELQFNVAGHTFQPGSVAAQICVDLNVQGAPAIIFRYRDVAGQWKKGLIDNIDYTDYDYVDLRCIMDAVNDNDQLFFGFDQYDVAQEDNANVAFNRLLHLIHGEPDQETMRERRLLKKEIA